MFKVFDERCCYKQHFFVVFFDFIHILSQLEFIFVIKRYSDIR